MPNKRVVAVDFDDLIYPTSEEKVDFLNQYGNTNISRSALFRCADPGLSSFWAQVDPNLGAKYGQRTDAYQRQPIEGAREGIRDLAELAVIQILSSGYDEVRPLKTAWAAMHMPEISGAHYLGAGESKAEICLKMGASLILEDRYDYARECANAGIPAIVLLRYAWSYGVPHPLIKSVGKWEHIPLVARRILASAQHSA